MKSPKISPETALEIHELRHAVTKIRLGEVTGHDELWGALGAAGQALEYCEFIARRDVARPEPKTAAKTQWRGRVRGSKKLTR